MKLLLELGGEATGGELSQLAKQKYPKASLWPHTGKHLKRLQKDGLAENLGVAKAPRWRVTAAGQRFADYRRLRVQQS